MKYMTGALLRSAQKRLYFQVKMPEPQTNEVNKIIDRLSIRIINSTLHK